MTEAVMRQWLKLTDRQFIKQRLHMTPLTKGQAELWRRLVSERGVR